MFLDTRAYERIWISRTLTWRERLAVKWLWEDTLTSLLLFIPPCVAVQLVWLVVVGDGFRATDGGLQNLYYVAPSLLAAVIGASSAAFVRRKVAQMKNDPSFRIGFFMVHRAPSMMVLHEYLRVVDFDALSAEDKEAVKAWVISWWRAEKLLADGYDERHGTAEHAMNVYELLQLVLVSVRKESVLKAIPEERLRALLDTHREHVMERFDRELADARRRADKARERMDAVVFRRNMFTRNAASEQVFGLR